MDALAKREAKLFKRAERSTWATFSASLTPNEARVIKAYGKTEYGFWVDSQRKKNPYT